MTENLTMEMFSNHLNTSFEVQLNSPGNVALELREVNEGLRTPRNEQFALIFHGPKDLFLPQAIYHLNHEKMGEFDVFLVPVGKGAEGFQYEAVFNRFIEEN